MPWACATPAPRRSRRVLAARIDFLPWALQETGEGAGSRAEPPEDQEADRIRGEAPEAERPEQREVCRIENGEEQRVRRGRDEERWPKDVDQPPFHDFS